LVQDVAHPDAGGNLDQAVRSRWAPVSGLVNNAGIPSPRRGGHTAGFLETTVEEWNAVLEVNLSAALRLCRAFIPFMRERRWGRIVCVSSLAGRSRTYISGVSYMAAKAGLLALSRSIAGEFGRDGITANCVAPGYIDTAMAALHGADKNAEIACGAGAQTVGFATLQPGTLLNAQASVIAKVVQDHSKLQVRVIGYGGDTGIIDAVNSGTADFLLLDIGEPAEAQRGENVWRGNAKPNLRVALTLYGFQMAFWVRKDSPVQSIADLKGKHVPSE